MITLVEAPNFELMERRLGGYLLDAPRVEVERWHAQDVRGNKQLISRELMGVVLQWGLPFTQEELAELVQPNLPWAEEHFQERVSGEPLNPPPSAAEWGGVEVKGVVDKHRKDFDGDGILKYSHTYPERFWPKFAGDPNKTVLSPEGYAHNGIRFPYGDLLDVVALLAREPNTRQAYLPVWFPEDTGAVHGERVPCTLGYHFMIRQGEMHITYLIRSVDFVRHFRDDFYLAGRLAQWVREQLINIGIFAEENLLMGRLTMHIMSLHVFNGDMPRMKEKYGLATE